MLTIVERGIGELNADSSNGRLKPNRQSIPKSVVQQSATVADRQSEIRNGRLTAFTAQK
jgi:hypothetical protein